MITHDELSNKTTDLITIFIDVERIRFTGRDNNLFAFSFSHIHRYLEFLKIIQARCNKASDKFIHNTKVLQATFKAGTHLTSEEQMRLYDQGQEIAIILHLEIESYYLFAKIVLDKIARAFQFYFGAARGLPLHSHDKFVKHIIKYIEAKGLKVPQKNLMRLMQSLKKSVSDYRDYEIAHDSAEMFPSKLKMTMFSYGKENKTWLASTNIYPTKRHNQVESMEVNESMNLINNYVAEIIKYIQENKEKTNLKVEISET